MWCVAPESSIQHPASRPAIPAAAVQAPIGLLLASFAVWVPSELFFGQFLAQCPFLWQWRQLSLSTLGKRFRSQVGSRLAPLVFVWPLGLGVNQLRNRRPPLPLPLPAVFLWVKKAPLVFPEPPRGLPVSPISC